MDIKKIFLFLSFPFFSFFYIHIRSNFDHFPSLHAHMHFQEPIEVYMLLLKTETSFHFTLTFSLILTIDVLSHYDLVFYIVRSEFLGN